MLCALHAPGNASLLVEWAENFSPWIEETSPDAVWFDIRGLQLILGSWRHIATEISTPAWVCRRIACLAVNSDSL